MTIKTGFKPKWTEEDTQRAKEFEIWLTSEEGQEAIKHPVGIDEFMRWLHGDLSP